MADDAATVEQLQAALQEFRQQHLADQTAIDALRHEGVQRDRALAKALEQQTATAEILRVIASSPTELERVFNAVAERAVRLCDSAGASVWRAEGGLLRIVARAGNVGGELQIGVTRPISAQFRPGRVLLEGRVIQTDREQARIEFPENPRDGALNRMTIGLPMLRDGVPIGVISVGRRELRRYSEQEIALLQTFADQAVIAIENARLFEELERRNRELSEALEQRTATAEVLRVIASSPTDLHQVLDALVQSAVRLCGADTGSVLRVDGDEVVNLATMTPEWVGLRYALAGTVTERVMAEARTVHLHVPRDEQAERYPGNPTVTSHVVQLSTPLLRQGQPIGALSVARNEHLSFDDRQIALLETFADQAVIAIENARLFAEL